MDCETTGKSSVNSGPFEIAFLVYKDGKLLEEKVFHLNPLNDEVIIHQEALDVNGATEEEIRSYPPAKEIVREIVEFLKQYETPEKLVFAGYNCPFDYGHLGSLFFREGYFIQDYFSDRFIDVLELVRKAESQGLLERPEDGNSLGNITKSLQIEHEAAHTALSDIKATRKLYEEIYLKFKGRKA
jgi:DNA polymerase III epsilon subunit-like protein